MKSFFKNNKILILILVFAAVLRLVNMGFQAGSHPDERGIVMISLDIAEKGLNPKNFHYGHFVYYLLYFTSTGFKYIHNAFPNVRFIEFLSSYDGAFYIGRFYATLLGLITIIFTYLLATRFFNKQLGLLSAFFLATNPFFIQLSRYYTTDIFVTCFLCISAFFAYKAYKFESYKSYLLSFVFVSLAFVSKISAGVMALPLAFIFVLCLYQKENCKSPMFYFKYAFIPFWLCIAIFFVVEPFMFFDFKTFIGDNNSQLDMIKGRWMPPYTRQYLNTMPVFFHLKQMLFYTIRPVVFILMLLGMYRLYFKDKSNVVIKVFLSLLVFPGLLITSAYFVKFPRYLLYVYPYLMIFAALGVSLFKAPFKKYITVFSVVVSFIFAIDFVSIYLKEHSQVTVSKWIYANVPHGSTIINPHWDDVIPLHLPGYEPSEYAYKYHTDNESLNIYEESNERFLDDFANTLLKGDYIAFPSDKAFRAILDKFDQKREYSIKILSSFFDGSLGYEKVYVYKPQTFLNTLNIYNDDLSDESITLYDHPKSLVFKKVRNLSFDELRNEIKKQDNKKMLNKVLLTKNFDINFDNDVSKESLNISENTFVKSILYLILWLVALDLMSMYIIPFLLYYLKNLNDKAYGIFRLLGIIIFALTSWILASVFGVKLTQSSLTIILLFLYFISFIFIQRKKITFSDLKSLYTKDIVKIEVYYLCVFLLFAVFKFLSPEIIWGEKTMDLGFLNYFIRLEDYPCNDPWSIDNKLSYYFFGYFIFALIHKVFCIPAEYGFNLSLVTIASLLATTLTTLIFYLKKSINFAIFTSFGILFLSNLEKFYIYFFDKYNFFKDHPNDYRKVWQLGFDLFWKTSRVHEYSSNAISEYPFWSFIFSDLHPHVIAMPIFVCMLLWFAYLIKEKTINNIIYVVFPVTAVTLCMTNTWDAITICVFAFIFTLLYLRTNARNFAKLIVCFIKLGVISLILFLPFYFYNLSSSSDNGIGWVQTIEFHRLDHVIRHFGFWLFPIIACYFVNIREYFRKLSKKALVVSIIISAIPCVFASFSTFSGISWGIQIFSSFLIFIGLASLSRKNLILSSFVVSFAFLLSFTELCFIIDRPNTIFKFYIGMWFFISIASIQSLSYMFNLAKTNNFRKRTFRFIFCEISLYTYCILFFICFASSAISYYYMSKHTHIGDEKVKYTLNGTEFLKNKYLDRYKVVNYINSHIEGIPVLMENYGPSYHTNTSIPYQKYTGLPIIHGWDHHIFQRGTSRENMRDKKQDIRTFYKTLNKEKLNEIIAKYGIDLVVVGEKETCEKDTNEFEKNCYKELLRKPNKFDEYKDIFTLLYSSNNEAVYLVNKKLKDFKLVK